MILTDAEIRVLGVLIEKSLTQPGSYPLTLNSITLGANQLQNRDPVVALSEHDVSAANRTLQHKKLVTQAPPSAGARANRFEHKVIEVFHWDRRDQAIMAELMLRGRQTAGELRSRASRMTPFADVESVMVTLKGLMAREPPFVTELPREPGRSANRFVHLLAGEEAAAAEPLPPPERSAALPTGGVQVGAAPHELRALVEALTQRVAKLESRVDTLTQMLDEAKPPNSPMG